MYRKHGKRGVDLLFAIPVAIVTLPLLVLTTTLSALWFRSNPFFVQQRIGRNGHPFSITKIRSLPANTDPDLGAAEVAQVIPGRFGHFIRSTHLDELPQIFHIIGGSMSLVGPRPATVAHEQLFDAASRTMRQAVRPGLTGLWQITPAGKDEIYLAGPYDQCYVATISLRIDLWILWRTVAAVVLRRPTTDTLVDRRVRTIANVPSESASLQAS